jgi:transcriptional regulator with XRE-family HTH domain
MAKPFGDLIRDWSPERKATVKARAKELIAEELTLRDLRKAQAKTQIELAKSLGVGQEHVSRLEKKADMLLSTLANYVRALGGNLRLTAEFPGRPPVEISELSHRSSDSRPKARPTRKKKVSRAA